MPPPCARRRANFAPKCLLGADHRRLFSGYLEQDLNVSGEIAVRTWGWARVREMAAQAAPDNNKLPERESWLWQYG
jgi:hypothetical protein